MSSIFTETFEGGSNGATVTSSNTAFASTTGSALTFSNSPTPPQGTLAMQVTGAAAATVYAQNTITSTALLFRRLYVNPPATVTGSFDMVATRGSNSPRTRLRLNTDRTVSMLNGSTVVWTSTTVLPSGQWSRIEHRIDNTNGQQQCRLYVGANPHTTTVTEDSSNRTFNQGTIDTLRLGQLNSSTTGATTIAYDAVADDNATWPGPAVTTTPTISVTLPVSVAASVTLTAPSNTITVTLPIAVSVSVSVSAPPVPTPPPTHIHAWAVWARETDYAPSMPLKIDSIQALRKHMGVDTAVVTTPYSPEAWAACAPSNGILIHRDGVQQFSGLIAARQFNWDAETDPRPLITLECLGDEQHLADRPVFPNPLRAADDQTVLDHWALSAVASTAMWRLISDQAGPTCRADRQVSGLVMGADPGVGASRIWRALYEAAGPNGVIDALAVISAGSGADLGLRVTSSAGQLLFDIVQPRDLSDAVKFSADMRNLVGIFYRETAPTATHALANGSGSLAARARKLVVTTSALALAWGRQIWAYIDQSDTSDLTQLATAAQDAIDQGVPTVSLTVKLTDTEAATYGRDWDLGDKVTVFVGLPGQTQAATVTDVVRQIALTVDNTGKETVQPAIGSYDAKAIRPTPTQKQLAAAAAGLSNLTSRK